MDVGAWEEVSMVLQSIRLVSGNVPRMSLRKRKLTGKNRSDSNFNFANDSFLEISAVCMRIEFWK